MLPAGRRDAVYIETVGRPSSKIFDFFGISPAESPILGRFPDAVEHTQLSDSEHSTLPSSATLPYNMATENDIELQAERASGNRQQSCPHPCHTKCSLGTKKTAFSMRWFVWCANTGMIATILELFPAQLRFNGHSTIFTTLLYLFLALLAIFLFIYAVLVLVNIWAVFWYRKERRPKLFDIISLTVPEVDDGVYFTISVLINTVLIRSVTDPSLTEPTEHLFLSWFFVAISVLFYTVGTFFDRFWDDKRLGRSVAVLPPADGMALLAFVGGFVISISSPELRSGSLAFAIVLCSLAALGVAIFMTFSHYWYTEFLHPDSEDNRPVPLSQKAIVLFYLVGPAGLCAAALQVLGDDVGLAFGIAESDDILNMTFTLLSFPLMGIAAMWLIIALATAGYCVCRRELTWEEDWNSVVFSVAGLALSTVLLANKLDSLPFGIITCILLVFIIIVFFINVGFTAWRIIRRGLLAARGISRIQE
ncbi:voltage-dependent anion channel-domain-containing protein [Bombardia bombarda]|uniref:Voltage-dependent anion channel-domain-containing protein n=1 Tax=Bombardia bombarda TaxID=252184 RepID=A0AA39XA42_9PEZI|nr:voltage-dependent anion channel-domain-containing protein [Bombardia bombarda]